MCGAVNDLQAEAIFAEHDELPLLCPFAGRKVFPEPTDQRRTLEKDVSIISCRQ